VSDIENRLLAHMDLPASECHNCHLLEVTCLEIVTLGK
jgi:hypothetical protein